MSQDIAIVHDLLVEAPTQGRIAIDHTYDATRQVVLRFHNGWGLSIIHGGRSYGVEGSIVYWQHNQPRDEDFELDMEDALVKPAGVAGWLDQDALREMIADLMHRHPYRWGVNLAAETV